MNFFALTYSSLSFRNSMSLAQISPLRVIFSNTSNEV